MKRSGMIKEFRTKRGLSQGNLAKIIGCTAGYISQIENEITKPSLKFLDKFDEIFGENILHGHLPDQAENVLRDGSVEYSIEKKKPALFPEAELKYLSLPTSTKKLLDSVTEILESGNDTAIKALKSNVEAFLEMVRISKNRDENKGGD